jgi:endonuclease/exonuclease/phosphatase (EEP) superfamily protein YafD
MTEIGLCHESQSIGWTLTIRFLGLAIKRFEVDHFFMRGLTVLHCGRAAPSVRASDHEPIYARIVLR